MNEDLFPSGPWTGFYNYGPGDRHRMELELAFAEGRMSGQRKYDVGGFLIKGRYDSPKRECHWTKTYIGGHDVFYRGFREGKGIWGTWEITIQYHGGFFNLRRGGGGGEGGGGGGEGGGGGGAGGTGGGGDKLKGLMGC